MIIDFRNIERKEVDGFKGGNGPFLTKLADDGKVKIMHNILPAGSSIGLHTHTGNCEVMYILKELSPLPLTERQRRHRQATCTTAQVGIHIVPKTRHLKTQNSLLLCPRQELSKIWQNRMK